MPSTAMSARAQEAAVATRIAFGWVTRDLLQAGRTMARIGAACEECLYSIGAEVEVPADEQLRQGLFAAAERAVFRSMEIEAVKRVCQHWEDYRVASGLAPRDHARLYSASMGEDEVALAGLTGIAFGLAPNDENDQPALVGLVWMISGCEVCAFSVRMEVAPEHVDAAAENVLEPMTRAAESKQCPHWPAYLWRRGWEQRQEVPQ